jgi:hypothetical protein
MASNGIPIETFRIEVYEFCKSFRSAFETFPLRDEISIADAEYLYLSKYSGKVSYYINAMIRHRGGIVSGDELQVTLCPFRSAPLSVLTKVPEILQRCVDRL